jgi:hypothetical protein
MSVPAPPRLRAGRLGTCARLRGETPTRIYSVELRVNSVKLRVRLITLSGRDSRGGCAKTAQPGPRLSGICGSAALVTSMPGHCSRFDGRWRMDPDDRGRRPAAASEPYHASTAVCHGTERGGLRRQKPPGRRPRPCRAGVRNFLLAFPRYTVKIPRHEAHRNPHQWW